MARITGEDILKIALANPDVIVPPEALETGKAKVGKSKYHNVRCEWNGMKFDSKAEKIEWKNEREFQSAVVKERDKLAIVQPVYLLLYHISNENAHRNPGVVGGMPDLHLPVARGRFHSLYIELKVGKNKPSQKQLSMLQQLRDEGNHCVVVWDSVDEVIQHIQHYLDLSA